jgi:hypothetical protein
MSLRTKVDFQVAIGFDNRLDDTAFERSLTELLDTCEHVVTQTIALDPNASDVPVSFGDVTQARLAYIEADGEITYRVNGIGQQSRMLSRMAPPLNTQAPNLKAFALMTEVMTSLFVSNPSATDVRRLKVCIVGDLTT